MIVRLLSVVLAAVTLASAAEHDFRPREIHDIARNGTDITEDPVALALHYGVSFRHAMQVFEFGDHLAFLDDIDGQETPHLDWAAPHARKLRVLAIGNHAYDVGNFIQLRQRTDWDWDIQLWPRQLTRQEAPEMEALFIERFDRALDREMDVILLSGVSTAMPPALLERILAKADDGVGLVMINNINQWWRYPKEGLELWNARTPLPFGYQHATGDFARTGHPLAAAVDPAVWPPTSAPRLTAAEEAQPALAIGPTPIVAVRDNVVGVGFGTSMINRGMLPEFDPEETPRFDTWWEPAYCLYLRALLTAAGYTPPVVLRVPDTLEAASGSAPVLALECSGPGRLRWQLADPWGQRVAGGETAVVAGTTSIELPALHVNGIHRVDLWLLQEGRIVDFGYAGVRVAGGPEIAIERVEQYVTPGQTVHYRVDTPAGELRVMGVDDQQRVFVDWRQAVDGPVDIAVDTALSVLPHNILRFELRRDGQVVARRFVDLVLPRIGVDSLGERYSVMTYGQTNVEPHLNPYMGDLYRHAGFNTIYLNWHNRRYIRNAVLQGQYVATGAMSPYFKQPGFATELKNFPLKDEPRAEWSKNIAGAIEDIRAWGSIGRVLDDEAYIAYTGYDRERGRIAGAQVCQSETALAEFRRRMTRKYGDIARLNAHWGTDFAGFEDVRMITEGEVRDSDNPAGWLEFRDYMNDIYAEEYYRWMQAQHAPLGESFGVGPGAPGWGDKWAGTIYRGGDIENMLPVLRYIMAYGGGESRIFRDAFCGQPGAQKYDPPVWWREWGPWKYLFEGADALWFYASRQIIGNEMSWRKHAEWAAQGVSDIVAGAGPLVRDAEPLDRDVRILWSTRNTGLGWLWGQRDDAWNGLGLEDGRPRSGATLERLLRDQLFLQPSYITETRIAAGGLADCRLLILPQALALEDSTIAALREYVDAGGAIVADVLPGTRTAMGAPREDAPLADLFGVDVGAAELHRERETWYSVGANREGLWQNDQLWLPADTTFRGIEPTTARVDGKMLSKEGKESKAFFINETGAGRTMLLNFVYCDLRTDTLDWHLVFARRLLEWADIAAPARVVNPRTLEPLRYRPLYAFRRGRALLLGSVRGRSIWSGGRPIMVDDGAAFDRVVTSRFVLGDRYHIYDVRAGEYRGLSDAVDIELPSFEARLLALLPYGVEGIAITAPDRVAAGSMLTLETAVQADNPGEHVLHIELVSPTGYREPLYRRTVTAPGGRARVALPLAFNDRPGSWRLVVRDLMSGVSAEHAFELMP